MASQAPDLNAQTSCQMTSEGSRLSEALQAYQSGQDVDTMELSHWTREHLGSYEYEYCFGEEESELHQFQKNCKKNPGHEDFIALDDLTFDRLPNGYQDQKVLDIIHDQAAMTVKVKTRYFSTERSNADSELKGKSFARFGTGFVIWAAHRSAGLEKSCPCTECTSSGNLRNDWYELIVTTAIHHVFDQAEADKTTLEFSYYKEDGTKVKRTLQEKCQQYTIDEDICSLTYNTHDEDLGNTLVTLVSRIHQRIEERFKVSQWENVSAFLPIVSHPHGRTKHVTFGNFRIDSLDHLAPKKKEGGPLGGAGPAPPRGGKSLKDRMIRNKFASVSYTTSTCPGSSGAAVIFYHPGLGKIVFAHSHFCQTAQTNKSGGGTLYNHYRFLSTFRQTLAFKSLEDMKMLDKKDFV